MAIRERQALEAIGSILALEGGRMPFGVDTLVNIMKNPQGAVLPDDPRYRVFQSLRPLNINTGELNKLAYVGPPRVYRIVATGEAGRVKKKITAIVDTARILENALTLNPASEKAAGVLQYWRED